VITAAVRRSRVQRPGVPCAGILDGVSRRLAVWGAIWLAGSVGAFLVLDPILASFIAIFGLCLWGVAVLASNWDQHSSFEQRERDRARRRAERRERTKDARARDRARWEAHQQRKADRSAGR
jgi:type IV secretory pathway TrbD component